MSYEWMDGFLLAMPGEAYGLVADGLPKKMRLALGLV